MGAGIGRRQNNDRTTDPGAAQKAAQIVGAPIGQRLIHQHRLETLAPCAPQRRRGIIASDAGELGVAFELIDETAAARGIRINDQHLCQHPETRLHAAPNRHAHPRPPRVSRMTRGSPNPKPT